MQINLIDDPSVTAAPAGFQTALAAAAQYLDALITNPITVNISVGYGEVGGTPLPANVLAEGGPQAGTEISYAQLKTYLAANASSAADNTAMANLPADPTGGGAYFISGAQEKAWGLLSTNGGEIDGVVGFSSTYPYFDYDPNNRAIPNQNDFLGAAEHELTHALGRLGGLGPGLYTPLDLFRYAAPGRVQLAGGQPAYFSIDGGKTNLDNFSTSSDYGDWNAASTGPDSFDDYQSSGVINPITPPDITELDVLGFSVAGNSTPPTAQFAIADISSGSSYESPGNSYTGPVSGLQSQYVNISPDNLNVAALLPNVFIHSGSGTDALSALTGVNVLDGGTGSNFLTGGSGTDTFFLDDRSPSADIWSTVVGFHAGDAATVWGVSPQDFSLTWQDNQGAAGYTGLTLHAAAPGAANASLTLAGYTSADLGSGRLSVNYGTDPSSGSKYMYVHANS